MLATSQISSDNKHNIEVLKTSGDAPPVLMSMLQNLHLSFDEQHLFLDQDGEFWYWMLTSYGLDLMRLLIRCASKPFSYAETFSEMTIQKVPQLLMLTKINNEISKRLHGSNEASSWEVILANEPYLAEKAVLIDTELLELELEPLLERIKHAAYSETGNRVYLPRKQV